jgi:hypothetical protein
MVHDMMLICCCLFCAVLTRTVFVNCSAEIISEDAVHQWIAAREALEEDVQEDAAEGVAASAAVVMGSATATVLAADRVKLFREPAVQAFVEWVQDDSDEEEEGSSDGDEDDEEESEDD